MKIFKYLLQVILCLFFVTTAVGQQEKGFYYYYQGEKVNIQLDKENVSFSIEGKALAQSLRSKFSITSNKLSELVEDYTRSMVLSIDKQSMKRKDVKTFYFEMFNGKDLSDIEYNRLLVVYNKLSNLLIASPAFITREGKELGLSNNFYVKLKNKGDVKILYDVAKKMNVEVLGHNRFMPLWFTLSVTKSSGLNALKLANRFYETGLFKHAEPAFMHHDLLTSNDPYFGDQWTLKNIGQNGGVAGVDIKAEAAWQITTGANVNVAVFDQGFEMDHPDLQTNVLGSGFDAQTNSSPSQVRGAHGTACAGIVAAKKDNNTGVTGVAPNSKLISVSVAFGFGTTYQMLANGINWSWQNGADVISNSWGGGSPSSLLDNAINNALNNGRGGKGTVVVFSSGNGNVNGAEYPSNSNPKILCVGAVDRCGVRSGRINIIPESCDPWCPNCKPGSSYGLPLDVVAGGTSVPTTDRQGDVSGNGDYNPSSSSPPSNYSNYDYTRWFGGTSAACPYVAGVVALVLSVNPALTVEQVNNIIEQSAQKVRIDLYSYQNQGGRPNGTWNNQLGYGLVDAHQAVVMAQNSGCSPFLTITQNVAGGTTSNQQASNTITASNKIFNNGTANYKAGSRVRLVPGFRAYTGSKFRAYIGACTSFTAVASNNNSEDVGGYVMIDGNEVLSSEPISNNSDWNFNIFPNPTKGNITIDHSFETGRAYDVNLYDFKGKLVLSKKISGDNKDLSLDGLNNGIYLVKIVSNNKYFAKKIILNR